MPISWDTIKARLILADASGKPLSALTGQETDAELRELALHFSQQCPVGRHNRCCPFRTLNGVSYGTVKNIISQMSRESLRAMFEDERLCRGDTEQKCCQLRANP